MTDLKGLVKPLVWDKHPDADFLPDCNEHYGGGQDNLAGQNEYAIYPHPCASGYFVLDVMGNRCDEDFPSVEAAKAAAQADYEARILAALDLAKVETLVVALRDHHNWHLSQGRDGHVWGIDPVDAYSESGLCEQTCAALAAMKGTDT
jgi:hypothetical protein